MSNKKIIRLNAAEIQSGISRVRTAEALIIQQAIIEDVELQKLHAKKVEIYSMATPTVIIKDGKAETIWIDETNHPIIGKINELIELRTQQIIDAYSNGR